MNEFINRKDLLRKLKQYSTTVTVTYCIEKMPAAKVLEIACNIGDLLYCVVSSPSNGKIVCRIEACRVCEIKYYGNEQFVYGVREINSFEAHYVALHKDAFFEFEEAEKELLKIRGKK